VKAALAHRPVHTLTDGELLDELDQLVAAAARGDRQAIGAIAIAFGPLLVKEVRQELGELFQHDAGDVLQDFFLALLEGKLTFPSIRGGALPWMKREVRSLAREHLRRRGPDWDLAG
jgi:DNA-directed RNA polymerase specialized sigma24 family protein